MATPTCSSAHRSDAFDRRMFLRGVAGAGVVALGTTPVLAPTGSASVAQPGLSPYGPLRPADANGWLLPEGFSSRVVAVGGEAIGDHVWHPFSDGGACFAAPDGGWVYVSNSEVFSPAKRGGASAVAFDREGNVVDAYPILRGTTANCAGGATPWGTWLSCEEHDDGIAWECDPLRRSSGTPRPALGRFRHEAVAADPQTQTLYLTQDAPDGVFYRFTPATWGDLSSGVLDAAVFASDGTVSWVRVEDPGAKRGPAQDSAPGATRFDGAEGVVLAGRSVVFTTKGDNRLLAVDLDTNRHRVVWDGREPLIGADNLTVDVRTGDLFACEDGGNMEIGILTAEGQVAPFARIDGQASSELTGVAFSPDQRRMYVSSQRAPTRLRLRDLIPESEDDRTIGVVYELSGPFRGAGVPVVTVAPDLPRGDDAGFPGAVVAAGVTAGAAVLGGLVLLRERTTRHRAEQPR
jgi:secreted PhoX family phosphatase